MATTFPETDPRHHTRNIKDMLEAVISHVRGDIEKVQEPKAQALFETTAEVLEGLKTAYDHYDEGTEPGFAAENTDSSEAQPAKSRAARSTPVAPEVAGFEE